MASVKITEFPENDILISEMKEGDYGYVTKHTGYHRVVGKIVYCVYNKVVVSLNNPEDVWNYTEKANPNVFRVRILPKGTKIEITI